MILIALFFLIFATPISAQTKTITPSATPTSNTSEEIQKLREVVSQKVAEKLRQITNPSSGKKAFMGKIIQIDEKTFTLDYQNTTKIINISSDTVYIDSKGTKTKLANIKVGQDILVLGINDQDSFLAKRIIFIDPATVLYKRTVVIGKVVDVSRTSPIFSLIPSKNKNDLYQIKTDSKTIVYDPQYKKIKISDLKSGQKIIAVLKPDVKISKTYTAISLVNLDFTLSPTPTKK